MPPPLSEIPAPKGRGKDAADWLESQGIIARTPSIRSSDAGYLGDPFAYYLRRRLGLTSMLHYSEALSRGSWAHVRLELIDNAPSTIAPLLEARLQAREKELRELATPLGISSNLLSDMMMRERYDMDTTSAWVDSALRCQVPGTTSNLNQYLTSSKFRLLGIEVPISYTPRGIYGNVQLVGLVDRLIYGSDNKIWAIDYKTTSRFPDIRLESCPIEFQTWHYLYILQQLLHNGTIQKMYPELPSDVQIGGIIHIAIHKPTIRLGMNDRNFTIESRILKSGPNKGTIREEKVYYGEPTVANYSRRVHEWHTGSGEYAESMSERLAHPPINISYTHASVFNDDVETEYFLKLRALHDLATRLPHPHLFPRSADGMSNGRGLSPFAPFYHPDIPVTAWPGIIVEQGLVTVHRDKEYLDAASDDN